MPLIVGVLLKALMMWLEGKRAHKSTTGSLASKVVYHLCIDVLKFLLSGVNNLCPIPPLSLWQTKVWFCQTKVWETTEFIELTYIAMGESGCPPPKAALEILHPIMNGDFLTEAQNGQSLLSASSVSITLDSPLCAARTDWLVGTCGWFSLLFFSSRVNSQQAQLWL